MLFENYSRGLETGRDAWCFNASREALSANANVLIDTYNTELERFNAVSTGGNAKKHSTSIDGFVNMDSKRISWTSSLKAELARGTQLAFKPGCLTRSLYRPFTRCWVYYNEHLVHRVGQMPRIFPLNDASEINQVICVSGGGGKLAFSALMTSMVPSLHMVDIEGTQCFPRWIYDAPGQSAVDELGFGANLQDFGTFQCRDAITDAGLLHFQAVYPGEEITKDDLFHYVYGLLHSPDYRERFADNLSKELPRIPAVTRAEDFWAFVSAGRELADLHCGFENVKPYPVTVAQGDLRLTHIADPVQFYRVEKMRFGGKNDRTTVIYNRYITITGIPAQAYDFVVNGKPALVWVMERQGIKTDKDSGIVSDANAFANETMEDPAYPFKLFCRVITVSLRTMEIVRSLPPLDIASDLDASAPGSGDAGAAPKDEFEVADAAE